MNNITAREIAIARHFFKTAFDALAGTIEETGVSPALIRDSVFNDPNFENRIHDALERFVEKTWPLEQKLAKAAKN
jgi:hypothetical protein